MYIILTSVDEKKISCLELYRRTLLPNINCLYEFTQKLIYLYQRKKESISLALLDIDNMKHINKELGYEYGNFVLLKISEIIDESIRKSDIAGKYKGSSFLIILPNADIKGAERVINRIKSRVEDYPFKKSVGITIAVWSSVPDGESAEEVLGLLESHIANSKKIGGNSVITVIEKKQSKKSIDYQRLLQCSGGDRLEPAFQPIYNLHDGNVEGYEVLMRIVKEDGTILPAGYFIKELLETSFMSVFEEIVLNKAFLKFKEHGLEGRLFINLPHNLVHFVAKGKLKIMDFYKEVISHRIEPSMVVIEVSEGKMTASTEDLVELINEVRSYGFGIALDDFGIEHSSVERLIKTKPDIVKLDGFFLGEHYMLKWVIRGMKKLGFRVVVEQIETGEDLKLVRDFGADMAQGFYLGRPIIL
ncbi:MAG: EAL domain-containing protein [Aquificaceae bacterium]|nr:EAL domain-containing protein [Aquificaceae bacterium]